MSTAAWVNGKTIEQSFEEFHAANPHVYEGLLELALKAKRRGRRRLGIAIVFEALRWNRMMTSPNPNDAFKLNNNYRAHYARMLMASRPELVDFFETRVLRA